MREKWSKMMSKLPYARLVTGPREHELLAVLHALLDLHGDVVGAVHHLPAGADRAPGLNDLAVAAALLTAGVGRRGKAREGTEGWMGGAGVSERPRIGLAPP